MNYVHNEHASTSLTVVCRSYCFSIKIVNLHFKAVIYIFHDAPQAVTNFVQNMKKDYAVCQCSQSKNVSLL